MCSEEWETETLTLERLSPTRVCPVVSSRLHSPMLASWLPSEVTQESFVYSLHN